MEGSHRRTRIEVVGVGGAGGDAVNRMISAWSQGVELVAVDTDLQGLKRCGAGVEGVGIGPRLTHGLGSGGDWTRGRDAAEESRPRLAAVVEDADLVFIAAGLGGGTGTGASCVLAEVARAAGALTISVVTRPFRFEGRVRNRTADAGIEQLREKADALIVIPNDRLSQVVDKKTTLKDAFGIAADTLRLGVRAIADPVANPAVIDLDVAGVRAIMTGAGEALMATCLASGPGRAENAARQAVASPLLEASIDGASGVFVSITGGDDLTLSECERVAEIVRAAADPAARVVLGAVRDASMQADMRVTLVATTLHRRMPPGQEPPWPSGVPSWPRPRTDGEGAMALPDLDAFDARPLTS
jgi:cell division protein FtsZ